MTISGKNIQMIGFDKLDPVEVNIVNEMLQVYLKKLDNKTDYELLKLKLKMHQKSTIFMHELESELIIHPGMSFSATLTHKNLYKATSLVMKKLLSEVDHVNKKEQMKSMRLRRR